MVLIFSCASKNQKDDYSFDKELNGFQYPFKVNNFNFSSQNQKLTMAYMDIGKKSHPAIVLLHGKNFSGYYWERIANDLLNKGYRVIIPDQIGFGKSTKPGYYLYSFNQLALNTKNLLNSLKIKNYIVVGHSMGGMLAVNMATMYKESTKKLILINPIGLEPYLQFIEYKDPEFFYENEKKKTVEMFRNYQKKNYYDGKWSDEYEKLIVPFKGQIKGKDFDLVAWNNALTYNPIFTEDIVSKFSQIQVPTALIIGTRDTTGPGRGWKKPGVTRKLGQYKKLAENAKWKIKDSKLYELKGLGHMPQFEDYKRFQKVFFQALK